MSISKVWGGMEPEGALPSGGRKPDDSGLDERRLASEEAREGSSEEPLGCSCGGCARCHDCAGDSWGDI